MKVNSRTLILMTLGLAVSALLAYQQVVLFRQKDVINQLEKQKLTHANQEKVGFIHHFFSQLESRPDDYLSAELKSKRLSNNSVSAKLQVVQISSQENHFLVLTETSEGLFLRIHMKLAASERTMNNPWGLMITELKTLNKVNEFKPSELPLMVQQQSIIDLPCALQELPKDSPIKLQTQLQGKNSQLLIETSSSEGSRLKLRCAHSSIELRLNAEGTNHTLYVKIPSRSLVADKKDPALLKAESALKFLNIKLSEDAR